MNKFGNKVSKLNKKISKEIGIMMKVTFFFSEYTVLKENEGKQSSEGGREGGRIKMSFVYVVVEPYD